MLRKSPKCQGPAHCKSGSGNNNTVSRRNHLLYHFLNNNPPPPGQFLRDKILLKKNWLGEFSLNKLLNLN